MAHEPAAHVTDPAPTDRLDSWKAIAAYLNRDVRTVQRWEVREDLPVHRHQHDQQASVYAYRTEVDAWRRSRPGRPEPVAGSERLQVVPPERRGRATRLTAAAALAVTGVVLAAVWATRQLPAPASEPRPPLTLLLSDAQVPAALDPIARDLRREALDEWRSAGGAVLADESVRAFLALMRQPPDAPLTPELAGQLAQRSGTVHLVGALAVDLREPAVRVTLTAWAGGNPNRNVARLDAAAESLALLRPRVRGLVRRLVEATRAAPPPPVVGFLPVTTTSLAALQRYDEADGLMRRGSWEAAAPLLRQAVALDPEFASAHIHLAWVLSNLRHPRQAWHPHVEQAEALRDRVSEIERCFITGSAAHLKGDRTASTPSWACVLALDPDHYWALGNLASARTAEGDVGAANDLVLARARAHPDSLVSQMVAATILFDTRQPAEARQHLTRVAALAGTAISGERQIADRWLPLAQACEAWLHEDVLAARSAVDRAAASLAPIPSEHDAHDRFKVGLAYLGLGMAGRAHEAIARASAGDERDQVLALVLAARGNGVEARRLLSGFATRFSAALPAVAPLLSEVGLTAEAGALLARWDRERFWPERLVAPLRASVMADRGARTDALQVLESALPALRSEWTGWMASMPTASVPLFEARRLQARLLVAAGRLEAAIAALEEGQADEAVACTPNRFGGFQYLAMLADLARLHRQRGDVARARVVESTLRERLALADADLPILLSLGQDASAISLGSHVTPRLPVSRE